MSAGNVGGGSTPFAHINEQQLASRMIFTAAGASSAKLDTFSNWMMLGYGAAIGLLLDKGDKYLPGVAIHRLVELFLWMAVLGVIAKYLSVVVSGASTGNASGREAMSDLGKIDPQVWTRLLLQGLPHPARYFTRRLIMKALSGDLISGARLFFLLAQLQGALTILQALCLIGAIYTVYDCAAFSAAVQSPRG